MRFFRWIPGESVDKANTRSIDPSPKSRSATARFPNHIGPLHFLAQQILDLPRVFGGEKRNIKLLNRELKWEGYPYFQVAQSADRSDALDRAVRNAINNNVALRLYVVVPYWQQVSSSVGIHNINLISLSWGWREYDIPAKLTTADQIRFKRPRKVSALALDGEVDLYWS